MMPSSHWLQLSYVCGSYDKVFLLGALKIRSVVAAEAIAAKCSRVVHRRARSRWPYIDMAGEGVPGPSKLGGIRKG